MRIRALLVVSLVLAIFTIGPRQIGSARSLQDSRDLPTLRVASLKLATHSRSRVLHWLNTRAPVASAVLGRDGRTIDILFRDGIDTTIVPKDLKPVRLHLRQISSVRPRLHTQQVPPGRALVAEPFAFELGGPNIGDVEVAYLRGAGFNVDYLLDEQVSLTVMQAMASYSFVYFHTHSGVDRQNNGVVVTGVKATTPNPPAIQALINDGTVRISGVAGTADTYYAILPGFITMHMGRFAKDSIVFLNGCQLLGTNLEANFLSQGATTVVGWDNEVQDTDSYFNGAAFLYFMSQKQTVAAAIASTIAAGLGTSTYAGATAKFGSSGDGTNTLARALGGAPAAATATPVATPLPPPTGPPPPPPPVTGTAVPAATSTSTPVAATAVPPTATAIPATATAVLPTPTSLPPPVTVLSLGNIVKPGKRQAIRIQQLAPNTSVHYFVAYPNGDTVQGTVTTDLNGVANFGFLQAPSKISRDSSVALVTIEGQVGTQLVRPVTVTAQYQIDFGPIDIAAQPRDPVAGQSVTIWVHTKPNTVVHVIPKLSKLHAHTSTTGSGGWTHVVLRLPAGVASGKKVSVRAEAELKGKLVHSATNFTVK